MDAGLGSALQRLRVPRITEVRKDRGAITGRLTARTPRNRWTFLCGICQRMTRRVEWTRCNGSKGSRSAGHEAPVHADGGKDPLVIILRGGRYLREDKPG
jgi:hypothetical protein